LCALGVMGLQLLGPLLISVAIDRCLLNRPRASWVDPWLAPNVTAGLRLLSLGYLAVLILNFGLESLQAYLAQWSGQKAMLRLRRLFEHMQNIDISFYDANPVGRLVTRLTTDVEALSEIFSNGIVGMLANLMMMAFFLFGMLALNARMTLLLGAILPVFVVLTI